MVGIHPCESTGMNAIGLTACLNRSVCFHWCSTAVNIIFLNRLVIYLQEADKARYRRRSVQAVWHAAAVHRKQQRSHFLPAIATVARQACGDKALRASPIPCSGSL